MLRLPDKIRSEKVFLKMWDHIESPRYDWKLRCNRTIPEDKSFLFSVPIHWWESKNQPRLFSRNINEANQRCCILPRCSAGKNKWTRQRQSSSLLIIFLWMLIHNQTPYKIFLFTQSSEYVDPFWKPRSIEGYFIQDLRLSYELKKKFFKSTTFILQLNNLLNKLYVSNGYTFSYLYGGLVTENYYYPMAPFNFMAGINISL